MGKIKDTTLYPKVDPTVQDYFVGTRALDGKTVNFEFSKAASLLGNIQIIRTTLSSQSTYQNNDLKGASFWMVLINGTSAFGSGILDSNGFNSTTGKFTFNSSQSGRIEIIFS